MLQCSLMCKGRIRHWVDRICSLELLVSCLCVEEPINQLHTDHLLVNIWCTHMLPWALSAYAHVCQCSVNNLNGWSIHPSIHYLSPLILFKVAGGWSWSHTFVLGILYHFVAQWFSLCIQIQTSKFSMYVLMSKCYFPEPFKKFDLTQISAWFL